MRTKYMTTVLIALFLASSGPALATHEGTWHGNERPASLWFCGVLGTVAGESVELLCLTVVR